MADITEVLLTDIAHVGDMMPTPGGDLGTISGLANLKNALFHRLVTVPGTLVHRPDYGVGAQLFQNAVSSFGQQQKLASIIQEQFLKDSRVQAVTAVSINAVDENPQQTTISVKVKALGYDELAMTFTPFVGGL